MMESFRYAWLTCFLAFSTQATTLAQEGNPSFHPHESSSNQSFVVAGKTESNRIVPASEPSFPSLKPRAKEAHSPHVLRQDAAQSRKLTGPTITVVSSLAVVLGLFAALVWASRRMGNGAAQKGALPQEVMQMLGSTPIDVRTRITMLRCGTRILVIAQSQGSTQTLCEITDPEEVRQLIAACVGNAKHDFATALRAIEKESTGHGFIGSERDERSSVTRRKLFASV